jgi:hypothetical protein
MSAAQSRGWIPRGWIIGILALIGSIAILFNFHHRRPDVLAARTTPERPKLLLVTSLPLIFSEQFSIEDGGSATLKALESRYRVAPIGVTDRQGLAKGRLLLMAHPLAQPAEDLVALDEWVRSGGHLLLLADPQLDWPSTRLLGDPLRPPPMFMDTGLLHHWGLNLLAPSRSGAAVRKLAGIDVLTDSPGELSGTCDVSRDRLVAYCRIGKGRATVVADADFLDRDRLGPRASHNLDALVAALAALESK